MAEHKTTLPQLNAAQETKLKHLTILSLALLNRVSQIRSFFISQANHTHPQIIPYSTLLSTLELDSIPALEELLIEGFYSNVISGKLDQRLKTLEIINTTGRDVKPTGTATSADSMDVDSTTAPTPLPPPQLPPSSHSLESITQSLSTWLGTISSLLNSLDKEIAKLQAQSVNEIEYEEKHEAIIKKEVDDLIQKSKKEVQNKDGKGEGTWLGFGDTVGGGKGMEVDGEGGGQKRTGRQGLGAGNAKKRERSKQ